VGKDEFLSYRRLYAEQFDTVELLPHEPARPRVYYCHPDLPAAPSDALDQFLKFFRPASPVDAALLRAAALTVFWGGGPGQRPGLLIGTDEDGTGAKGGGRGCGKTTFVRMLGRLAGGYLAFDRNESAEVMKQRLLSPD